MMRRFIPIIVAASLAAPAIAQERTTRTPDLDGHAASAPIPPELHQRNTGGSDGAGLCVIASMVTAGRHMGIDGRFLERLWANARKAPGGYDLTKLETLIHRTAAECGIKPPGYFSYIGTNPAAAERLSQLGIPFGMTLTQAEYASAMHHMVTDIDFEASGLSALVDNNLPGRYRWMAGKRRWVLAHDGGVVWLFAWMPPPKPITSPDGAPLVISVILLEASIAAGLATLLALIPKKETL